MTMTASRLRGPVNTVGKAWGWEVWITNNEEFCGKMLHFRAGSRGSLHYHKLKSEVFLLHIGTIDIEIGDERYRMFPGHIIDIPAGTPHRVEAIVDSDIIEFSSHHDDDDTYRIEASES